MIGLAIYAGVMLVRAQVRPTVRLDAQELNQLVEYWQLQAQRPPNAQELRAIIRERVDEELLAREAVRLGLDKDDLIVRRRLAQKMSFASEDAAAPEPTEAQLRELYARTKARYATPEQLTLRQLFFSARRGAGAAPDAQAALAQLARGGPPPTSDPALLPLTYSDAPLGDLARDYGQPFADALARAPLGSWIGPLASPYGVHLVRVEGRTGAVIPPFETVRPQVRDAFLVEARQAANAAFLNTLRKRYRVVVEGVPS